MIETWFISDTHLGHKNILEYEKETRPFNTLEEMHETIIDRWNAVVGKKDNVYHCGDVAFGRTNLNIISRLNGHKRLILGNHDVYPSALYLHYFEKLYGCLFWERCVITHMPVHPEGLGARWLLNVHGHLHSKNVTKSEIYMVPGKVYPEARIISDLNYFNVSCEQNNLTPIHADKIRERLKEL